MAICWNDLLQDGIPEDDYGFAVLSDKIWALGDTMKEVKAAVSADVFPFFVAINLIGNWENEGWGCVIGDHPQLVRCGPEALRFLGCGEIAAALEAVLAGFPDFCDFEDGGAYCDIVNFLQNVRFKVGDRRLSRYSAEDRAQMNQQFHDGIERLEQVTEPLWNNSAGWALARKHLAILVQAESP